MASAVQSKGMLENSMFKVVEKELVNMITTQRAYEMNSGRKTADGCTVHHPKSTNALVELQVNGP